MGVPLKWGLPKFAFGAWSSMSKGLLAHLPGPMSFRLLLAGAVLIPLSVLTLVTVQGWRGALEQAERDVSQKVDILHEHAAKLFETQQLVLWHTDALIRGLDWDEITGSEALHRELAKSAAALKQVDSIWLSDAEGNTRAGSFAFPLPSVNVADRDYFVALRAGHPGPYVSRTYPGRLTGRHQFNIARPILSAGETQEFDGVITVSASPVYLEEFYSRVSEVPGFSVALIRSDGEVLVRHPGTGSAPPTLDRSNPLIQAITSGADRGLHWAMSHINGVEKIYGWRHVDNFPVHVAYAIPKSSALAGWRQELMRNLAITAAATLALSGLVLGASKRRRLEVRILEDRFHAVQELSLDGVALLSALRRADGGIIDFSWDYANPAALRLLGATEEELIGLRLTDRLPGTAGGGGLVDLFAGVVETGDPLDRELTFAHDGIPGWFRCSAVKFGDGVAVQCGDVTDRRAVQEGLQVALAERDRLLAQKELLIKEVNHRVKNSLQLVSGMLNLDAQAAGDPAVRRRMQGAVGRVRAIATVHERLYRSDDVEHVEVAAFLGELCGHLSEQLGLSDGRLTVDADDTRVLTDRAPPLALLTNELVTNALKHGRAAGGDIQVAVTFRRTDGQFRLDVRDYGPGLPPGFDPLRAKGLGMRIAQGLAGQLGGHLSFEPANPGTRVTVIGDVEELTSSQAA